MALEVKIRGTWRTVEQGYSITHQAGAVATTKLNIKMETGDDAIETFDRVDVYLDIAGTDYLIFNGVVKTVDTPIWSTTYEAEVYPVHVVSGDTVFNYRRVSRNWYNKTYSEIVTDLYNDYLDEEGITLGTISTTAKAIRKYSAQDKKIGEILDDIAEKVGGCSYYLTPAKVFHFILSTEFPSVTAPTHLTELKRSSDYADLRTVQKVRGASTRITGTASNAALIADIATRSGLSGKIEHLITNSDIHNPTDAGTEATAQLANYAEDEEVITCVCHDIDASELYNEWTLNYPDLGIVGYYIVVERTITHFVDDQVTIRVKLQNRNFFARTGWSLKKALVASSDANTSVGDSYNEDALTPGEKITTRRQWYATVEEKTILDSQADAYSVSRIAYDAAFQALADYLNDGDAWSTGLPSWVDADNISVITEIDDDEYIETWNDYFIARDTLRHNIEDAIEAAAEAAEMRVFASVALLEAATGVRDEEVVTCLGEFYKWDATNSEWDKMTGSVLPLPTLQVSPRFTPSIPDSPAGTTYRNKPKWTTGVDSWEAYGAAGPAGIVDGVLRVTSNSTTYFRVRRVFSFSAKTVVVTVRCNQSRILLLYATVGGVADTLIATAYVTANVPKSISAYISGTVTLVHINAATPVITGTYIEILDIYIGTGAYLTPALDESGSGNHLTNTGVVPGEEDGRKVLLFNGQNSKLVASGPLTGAVFTILLAIKRVASAIGSANRIVADRLIAGAGGSGFGAFFDGGTNKFYSRFYNSTSYTDVVSASAYTSVNDIIYLGLMSDGAKVYGIHDGILSTGITFAMDASNGIFCSGFDVSASAYSAFKLFGLYLTDKVLTQDEITWFVNNGLPAPNYTMENYLLDKSADDGSMSPADKASELTDWMEHWYEDERITALPTTFASITTAGKYKETATIANTAGIWTPTTASTAAKTYYDASEAYRAVLFNYSTAGTGFLLRVNRNTATDISALSPTLNALRTALAAAETALRDEALRILTRKLNISGATSYGYEGGATTPDPTNLVLTASATGFTPSTYQWQYYDAGWNNLTNDTGKVAGATTSELTIYYNATPWGTARYLRVRCLADSAVYQEVTLTKIYDGVDGTSISLKGSVAEPADLADIVDPAVGDLYTCIAGGTYGGVTYVAGDGAAWVGSAWFNAGPIQGPAGTDGESSYLHIKFSAHSDGTGFSDTTNKYIGRAVTTSATAPTDKGDYTWTKWIGDDATSYWIYLSPEVVIQSVAGAYTPSTIAAYAKAQSGSGEPGAYSGRFIVATYDGSTWTDIWTSSRDVPILGLPASGYWENALSVRFRLYKAGGTTTLLYEKTCQIVQDGSDAGRYLGRYHAGHPASYNNLDRWTVYDAPSGYTTQPGVWYSDAGTPTRITVASDVDVRCYMAEAIEDVAWAEEQGTYGDSSDYGMETIFQAVFAVTVACETMAATQAFITELKSNLITTNRLEAANIDVASLSALTADLGTVTAGVLQSTDWDATHGMQLDLTNRTIKIGGSTAPKFSVAATGVLSATDAVLAGTLAADSGLVGVAGSLRTVVGTGRVYFYRSNGTSWVLMGSMRGHLSGSLNGFYLSGGTDSDPCHLFTSGGSVNTDGGIIYTGGGDVQTNGGNVSTVGGYIETGGGDVYTSGGNVYSREGKIYSRATVTTSTSFANWFSPAVGESGMIFHNDGAYSGVSWYSRDDATFAIHFAGDAGYVQASGSYIQIKAARSGVSHTFHSIRNL